MAIVSQLSFEDGKTCTKCGEWKPFCEFEKAKGYKNGLRSFCRPCRRIESRANAKRWYHENKERQKITRAKWYAEKGQDYYRSWQSKNRKHVNKVRAEYRKRTNSHDVAIRYARKRGAGGRHTPQEWIELRERYGNRCLNCGSPHNLTRDHILPVSMGGPDFIWNIQPLCQRCNTQKYNRHLNLRPDRQLPPHIA